MAAATEVCAICKKSRARVLMAPRTRNSVRVYVCREHSDWKLRRAMHSWLSQITAG